MNFHYRTLIGFLLLTGLLLLLVFGEIFCTYDPQNICLGEDNVPPSLLHWFGTDDLGRDLFSRSLQGLRLSFFIGILAVGIDLIIGVFWGTISGMAPKRTQGMLMRLAEILYSVPYLIVVIFSSVFLGTGILAILTAMICIGWIQMARIVRHLVLNEQATDYILSARALGVSKSRQFFAHMIPNIIGPIITACMLSIPHAIFTEAFLSFLGIGIQPPISSLGSLVSEAIPGMRFYPWRLIFPASLISSLILSIMLIADGLRDYYDPKQRIMSE